MLKLIDYNNLRIAIGRYYGATLAPTHKDYQNYEHLWENYVVNVARLLNGRQIQRLGLIAMESAPGGLVHPHPNYIFHNTNNIVGRPADNYLINIFNGSNIQPGLYHNGLTKQNCLDQLLNKSDFGGNYRPIVLLDLLPTHGIKLNTRLRQFLTRNLILGVNQEITYKFLFLETNLLRPLGLNWNQVHIKFACPPTTSNQPSLLQGIIQHCAHGITIHPNSINTIGNGIVPNPNELRNNILNHGF